MTGPVRSVSQAFAILRLLGDAGALTLSDIGRSVGLSPSSCLNLLKTLVAEGAIEREDGTKRYRLTAPWQATEALRDSVGSRLVDRALPRMAAFAQRTEAAVGLWKIVSRDRMQLAVRAESDAGMRLSLADDQRQPLGSGAAGRAIAAVQGIGSSELARRYAPVRWQAGLPFETYARQVDEAAARGFAVDQGYTHRGVWTVAVGIAGIAPGYCLSASIVAGSRSEAEIGALGAALVALRDELVVQAG
ncbi:IclR family transcriptional regulator [Sphingopyxis sp.]|mgnify:CR=1 FL=1|uniref:IclR family transcriptional regulator n=1 Tax=Sphingopyxis sp. TaxID=1908224 RepID=UPI003D0C0250